MIPNVIIADDVISIANQIDLETYFTTSPIPWHYVNAEKQYEPPGVGAQDSFNYKQFVHLIYHDDPHHVNQSFPLFVPVLSAIPVEIEQLLMIKASMTVSDPNRPVNSYGKAHIDFTDPPDNLITCVYYTGDSDGDTVMFSKVDGVYTETQRIPPKRGRMIIFDGKTYHAGSCPTSSEPRIVVNFNFIPRIKNGQP
jgi:ectoine hydroxylase-related dioxygenase (phytanoyl-CoA dioxygenase family)